MPPRHRLVVAGVLSFLVLAAKLKPLPSLRDAITGAPATQYSLKLPVRYTLFAPFAALADVATFNSARQDRVLIVYLLVAYWIWFAFIRWRRRFVLFTSRAERRARKLRTLLGYPAYLILVGLFLSWAVLCRRPAAFLASADRDDLILDMHSHTSYSWDGRGGRKYPIPPAFTPQANILWHRRMGFTAGFVTDHNVVAGAREAKAISKKNWKTDGYRALEGEEISLHDLHIAVLGNRFAIDNSLYDKDVAGIFRYLKDAPKFGGLPVLSLPEYWEHYPETRWEKFAEAGAAGFEIVNSVPKALDFPPKLRADAVALCRKRHLFFNGVSDNHGWASAAYVWNVMHLPGQAAMDPDKLQVAVLEKLKKDGPDALKVVVRTKHDPDPGAWIALDPPMGAWTMARTFTWAESLMCLIWIWLLTLLLPSLEI